MQLRVLSFAGLILDISGIGTVFTADCVPIADPLLFSLLTANLYVPISGKPF